MIEASEVTDDYLLELARNGKINELRESLYHNLNKVDHCCDWAGDNLLATACWFDQKDIIIMLLTEFDANINCSNKNRSTPLHRCARGGSIDIVKLLLDKGANYNLKDITGKRPEDITDKDDIRSLLISKRIEDESFTMLLKHKHDKQDMIWNENQKVLEELEYENKIATRRKDAVSIVIDGAICNRVNGIFDPTGQMECEWPIYNHRENPFIVLKYNDNNNEWYILESICYESKSNDVLDHVLVRLPCSIPNYPELRIEGSNGIKEFKEYTKRDSIFSSNITNTTTSNTTTTTTSSNIKIETLAFVKGYEETLKIKEQQNKFCITCDESSSDTSFEEDWKQLSDSDERDISFNNNDNNDKHNKINMIKSNSTDDSTIDDIDVSKTL